jgi:hypothetical protein
LSEVGMKSPCFVNGIVPAWEHSLNSESIRRA